MRNLPPAHLNSTKTPRRKTSPPGALLWSMALPQFEPSFTVLFWSPLGPRFRDNGHAANSALILAPDRNGRVTSVTDKLGRQGRRAPLEQLPWSKALPQFEPSFTVSPLDTIHKKNLPKVLITIHANLGFNEPCFQQSQEELVR
jgi:hypothetical protein